MATVFNNLRVMRPSFSLPSSDHSQFGGIYAGTGATATPK
jgi:hypothetical protein